MSTPICDPISCHWPFRPRKHQRFTDITSRVYRSTRTRTSNYFYPLSATLQNGQTHSFVGLALKGLSSVHRSLTFLYLHVRKLSLFLYVWLIYVQYLFQYLFHPANHGFISLASCSHIRLLIVTVADFGKIFISHLVNLALEFYLSLGRIRIRWRCFQNIVDNSSSGCRLLL